MAVVKTPCINQHRFVATHALAVIKHKDAWVTGRTFPHRHVLKQVTPSGVHHRYENVRKFLSTRIFRGERVRENVGPLR